jgi:RNA polymerase II-associated factor 1
LSYQKQNNYHLQPSTLSTTSTAGSAHLADNQSTATMASGRPGEKVVHQDYIARIRYSNALPPPPHPPKLLEIPGTGLSGGQYTSAAYASRLAREQPLNIEADAELGMPIDLVGIPGVFDGDERGE